MKYRKLVNSLKNYVIIALLALLVIQYYAMKQKEYLALTYSPTTLSPAVVGDEPVTIERVYKPSEHIISTSRPIVVKERQKLLILAYQRTGSSLFGNVLDQDPKSFFFYEPLDAMMSSLYGTRKGLNVPTDITNYRNGSKRYQPELEIQSTHDVLGNLLSCQLPQLSVEILSNHYFMLFKRKSNAAYRKCLNYYGLIPECGRWLHPRCHKRFMRYPEDMKLCGEAISKLEDHNYYNISKMTSDFQTIDDLNPKEENKSKILAEIDENNPLNGEMYMRCLRSKGHRLSRCLPFLQRQCDSAKRVIVKTVRARMFHMRRLLRQHPTLKVIHLIRDPRAVLASRSKGYFFYSIGLSWNNVSREAGYYCRNVLRDHLVGLRLSKDYPNRLSQVVYDDFVGDAEDTVKEVYKRFGHIVPEQVVDFTKTIRQDSTKKWKSKLPHNMIQRINTECEQFFKTFPQIEM